jgi:pre-mRNA-processing factor 6
MAARPQRRSKSVDALKRCNDDPHVIAAVAMLFQNDRKVEKARTWFNRAITLNPDIGDFWALYYRFEAQHGGSDTAAEVLKRCVAAEPHHGERWQRAAKNPKNAHAPVDKILKLVTVDIEHEPAP